MYRSKGFINPLWLLVGLVIIAGAGYWFVQKPSLVLVESESSSATSEDIEAEVRKLIDPAGQQAFEMALVVMGQRYILFATRSVPTREGGEWEYTIADLQTKHLISPKTSGYYLEYVFSTPTHAVFAANDRLYLYMQDTPDVVEIPGSRLSGKEAYASKSDMSGLGIEATPLADSFTINVYDWTGQTPVKTHALTFPLPQ